MVYFNNIHTAKKNSDFARIRAIHLDDAVDLIPGFKISDFEMSETSETLLGSVSLDSPSLEGRQ